MDLSQRNMGKRERMARMKAAGGGAAPIEVKRTGQDTSKGSPEVNIIGMLKDSNDNKRMDACNVLASSIQADHLPGLIESRCVDILVSLLEDKAMNVAIAGVGALRNMCVEIGADASVTLANRQVANKIIDLLLKIDAILPEVQQRGSLNKSNFADLYWFSVGLQPVMRFQTQLFAVLTSLCESSDVAVETFLKANKTSNGALINVILARTSSLSENSDDLSMQVAEEALQLLRAVTHNNEELNASLFTYPEFLEHITKLAAVFLESNSNTSDFADATCASYTNALKDSLAARLAKSSPALSTAFSSVPLPHIPATASATASAVIFNLVHSAAYANVPADILGELFRPALACVQGLISASPVSWLHSSLQELDKTARLLIDAGQASASGALSVGGTSGDIPKDETKEGNGIDGNADVEDGEDGDGGDGLEDEAGESIELPIELLWSDAISGYTQLASRQFSATSLALDSFASLCSLLEIEQDEDDDDQDGEHKSNKQRQQQQQPKLATAVSGLIHSAVDLVLFQNTESIFNLASIRLMPRPDNLVPLPPPTVLDPPALADVVSAAGADLSPAALELAEQASSVPLPLQVAVHARLPEYSVLDMGKMLDSLRCNAVTALSSALTFLPARLLGDGLGNLQSLHHAVSILLTRATLPIALFVNQLQASTVASAQSPRSPVSPSAATQAAVSDAESKMQGTETNVPTSPFSVGSVEEVEALTSALLHIVLKPQVKEAYEAQWSMIQSKKLSTVNTEVGSIWEGDKEGELELQTMTTLRVIAHASHTPSSIKSMIVALWGRLGQSPSRKLHLAVSECLTTLLLSLLADGKNGKIDLDTLSETENALVDVYSEDDRHMDVFKSLKVTSLMKNSIEPFKMWVDTFVKSFSKKGKRMSPEERENAGRWSLSLDQTKQYVAYRTGRGE